MNIVIELSNEQGAQRLLNMLGNDYDCEFAHVANAVLVRGIIEDEVADLEFQANEVGTHVATFNV